MPKSRVRNDGTEAWNLHLLGHTNLGGHGDTMHVNVREGLAYVGHMGGDRVGTSIVDVSDPRTPRVVKQLHTPVGTHSHKVQVVDDLLIVNYERNFFEPDAAEWAAGIAIFDLAVPWNPQQIGFFPTPGKGVHRMKFTEPPYAYLSGSDAGYRDQFLIIADLTDPANPVEAGRWAPYGMNEGAGETPDWAPHRRFAHHHAHVRGDRAYATWWDGGLYILDVSDVSRPREISHLEFGEAVSGCTHTALPLPGRELLVVADEAMSPAGPHGALNGISIASRKAPKLIRLVDITDEKNPVVVSSLPIPTGDFAQRPGRFGPHNVHEMRPGSFQSPTTVHVTYFNAGLRVYDVTDASEPVEQGYWVPEPAPGAESTQLNDLHVAADGLIYVTDRSGGGLYIVEPEIAFR